MFEHCNLLDPMEGRLKCFEVDLTPKVLLVFYIKTTSRQPLLKARQSEQNWGFI
jgi:hypothetical protein